MHAVAGVDLDVEAGEIVGFLGPNGAGKTTTLRMLTTLLRPTEGTATVAGHDVTTTPTDRLAQVMAILGQQTAIASRLRLSELVAFGRWPHHKGRPGPQDHALVWLALKTFALTDLADRFLDEVSGGQAQRAHIAMAWAQDTDWLLLDEPLNNLDMAHARALMGRLRGLVDQGGRSVAMVGGPTASGPAGVQGAAGRRMALAVAAVAVAGNEEVGVSMGNPWKVVGRSMPRCWAARPSAVAMPRRHG